MQLLILFFKSCIYNLNSRNIIPIQKYFGKELKCNEQIFMKKEEIKYKIAYYEAERDRNLKIHCPRVAAKFQRMIDKLKKRDFIKKTMR